MCIENTITNRIRSKAFELGFSHLKIAPACPLETEGSRLTEWMTRGWQASMGWMERSAAKRIDPSEILGNVKSVVCAAMNYYVPFKKPENAGAGKISRYALGKDYHTVMRKHLEKLRKFIEAEVPGIETRVYVDTGPVMEKAWAVRAGIGWMGKHTNVITRDYGSWIFLGEILVDKELEYDLPVPDHCGTCTACIEACPTGAIVEPYILDSNRCISYLNIEHRDKIPQELVPKMNNWIFGCDICQDVCPWNRFQKESREDDFRPKRENIGLLLTELAAITEKEFNDRFRGTTVKRAGYAGLIRNVKDLLGYAGNSH
jgi:epoxyqueuosine reductase